MMTSFWLFALGCLAATSAYPLYGPKRLRSYSPLSFPMYNSRSTRQYYYDPYTQDIPEVVDIYPQDPYDRYRFYQVPYYFPETAPYYYDDEDIPEDSEEDKGDVPEGFGQDWYNQDGNAKANAFFLQNLILAQMYKDAANRFPVAYGYPRDDYDQYVYGEPVKDIVNVKEDDDVSQLKSLVKDSPKRQQNKNKPEQPVFPDNTWTEKRADKGQDEVVMPRPATFHQRVHQPSAYDAIKKLLQVQTSQQKKRESGSRQPQKRSYIPNEDALVEQLGNLKKSA
nr:uncharacterized protein LOC112211754 [Halyomorpha halys]